MPTRQPDHNTAKSAATPPCALPLAASMSVYTTVTQQDLEPFLERYSIGRCRALEPIAAGITNTNYRLDTDAGDYVLTLYEHHSDDELDYILGLQRHLGGNGVRCAMPLEDRRGELFSNLNQRPAAIIERLPGQDVAAPTAAHCHEAAGELARLHLAGSDYHAYRPNPRGLDWLHAARDMLADRLSADDREAVDVALAEYQRNDTEGLAQGAIHADLFRDNALFERGQLYGFIDFDYACVDSYAFDLAVMLNDWCNDGAGDLDSELTTALLQGYQAVRRLDTAEVGALPLLLRIAALRFWLSRLYDQTFPQPGEMTYSKSPDEFRSLLERRTAGGDTLASLLGVAAAS